MKNKYEIVGRRIFKFLPKIAESIINEGLVDTLLSDYNDISFLSNIFSEYYNIDFPSNLKNIPIKESTEYRIKFTALCLNCYDPESLELKHHKRVSKGLRLKIARQINTSPSLISQYVPKARVYQKCYKDFESEMQQLIAVVVMRTN